MTDQKRPETPHQYSQSPPSSLARLPRIPRSAGLKLILICGLVLLMSIPAMFIGAISYERSTSANQVVRDVSQRYGGEQTVIGPILAVPYRIEGTIREAGETGYYIVFPEQGSVDFSSVNVETKQQSLYKIPIYTATGNWQASFNDTVNRLEESGLEFDLDKVQMLISVADVRGLKSDIYLKTASGKSKLFEPASFEGSNRRAVPAITEVTVEGVERIVKPALPASSHKTVPNYGTWLSVDVGEWIEGKESLIVSTEIKLSGAQSVSIPPFAKSTEVNMTSNWPHPGFKGEFTPTSREITETGFSANWNMPYLSRGIAAEGRAHQILNQLGRNKVQVKFVDTASPYQTVNRALKYSVLFIGLVFLAYFLFEVIVGVRVHPAQYILIGLAQAIFYLLLLAFAERIGFSPAFALAAIMTVLITAGYAGAVFGGRAYIIKAGSVFAIVYGLLYVLMKIEDFALMIGALASFIAIAATMYLTRNMNWYGSETKS